MMVKEAALCLQDGIIESPRDGDIGAIFGIGFLPFSGGPFRFIDSIGAKNIVSKMENLQKTFGERFSPPEIILEKLKTNSRFYD